ncbi:two-component regulator propeller domain-containing protein [Candidatus Poribacteria bacterium]
MQRGLLVFFTAIFCLCITAVQAEDTVSIEGELLMLDDKTPHVAVPVEVVRNGEIVDLVLSNEDGEYQFVNLRSGQYQVRCQVLGGYVYYRATDSALRVTPYDSQATGKDVGEVLYVRYKRPLRNTDFRFAPFKKGTWKTYTYLDGLASNGITAIHQDADDNLWFATYSGGVSRYDGKVFRNFTTKDGLAHNDVAAIYGDPDGMIWFGTKGGVSRYDGKEFRNFTTEDGLAHNDVSAIHGGPDGTIWFGTGFIDIPGGGVSRYDGKEFENFTRDDGLADNTVFSIYGDPDGMLWFGTKGGVSRYDGKEFVNFGQEDGLADVAFHTICGDPQGNLWFGTFGGGVYRYDGKEFTNFTTKDGLAHDMVFDIHQDPDGVLWFATGIWSRSDGGVSRYDGKTFVNFTVQDGLSTNSIYSIYRTSDGAMWFGTTGGGVSRYDDKGLLNFTTKDGLVNNGIHVIHRVPDDILWLGTQVGVSRYDGKEFVNFTMKDGLANNSIFEICGDSQGNLWFGTWGGVSRYDGNGFENFTEDDGLANNMVFTVYCASDGTVYVGMLGGGASRYDGERFISFTKEDGLTGNSVMDIKQDAQGNLWFGTRGDGVFRYDGSRFENFTEDDGLADNWVMAVYRAPDDAVWFGTVRGGVSRYDGKEFRNFTVEDGLVNNEINDIYASPDGVMWFATEGGGVSRYDGAIWTSLDTRDGLAGNIVYSIRQDTEGYLWFGTTDGVTRYRPSATPPKVRIVSVRAQKQIYTELDEIPPITVGDDVTIECGAIDFMTVPEKRQYRYRISKNKKEMDSDWRKPVKSERFEWTPEKPGRYTFEVQAIDRDLNYSDPASVKIVISGIPFYHTSVFLVVLSITGGGSLLGVAILATQRRRASRAYRMAEQVQTAKMLSLRQLVAGVAHQMNNPIGAIASNNDVSSRAIEKIKERIAERGSQEIKEDGQLAGAFAVLDKMNEVNQDASGGIARTVADLRSFVRLDESEWQLADIHEAMDTVLDLMQSEFSNRIRITRDYGDIRRVYCSPSSLSQVFMSMFRNACEAIDREGEVHLKTTAEDGQVIVEISDTGAGIPAEDIDRIFDPGFTTKGVKVGVGLGLSICYQIVVDEHKGRIDVSSESGKGTTFTITIPQDYDGR